MRFSYCLFCLLWGSGLNFASAQSTHTPLLKGDRAYDRKQYKEAEKHYRTAADHEVGNPQALYNLGNTLYQQGNWTDAAQRFQQAATTAKNAIDKADALHNLGDAYLKDRKYKEAAQAYKESLRLRPADPDTKQNLQMALKKVKEEEQKEKEQQQKNQQQQQNQQNQDQNQSPQQNPQNQQDQQQDQQQKQPSQQPQQNPQGQPQQPQGEQQKKQEEQRLKKEDAKRLLETAIGPDDRKNAQKYRAAQQQTKPKGSKKDW